MTSNNTPAFPVLIVDRPKELEHFNGMTLRDYFAAKALQSFILIYEPEGEAGCIPDCAADAYTYADAMLEARK